MFRKLYRKMPLKTISKMLQWIYRHTFSIIWMYLLFVPRRLFKAIAGLVSEETDRDCKGTNDQLDVACSSTKNDNYQIEETDEFYCEYDSSWETNSSRTKETSRQIRHHRSFRFNRFKEASRDMQNYRHDYPEQNTRNHQQVNATPNLDFYLGKRCSLPDEFTIEEVHKYWFGDYQRLERTHSFIQWLFPLQEPGMNWQAIELTKKEIQAFQKNQMAKKNLLQSYKLMLDFYGLELSNETTGEVKKSFQWQERFNNLNRNTHNNLRITRILKCLGTLGYRHYQAPLVHFFLEETLVHHNLPDVKESVLNYFLFTVLDKLKRRELIQYAYEHFDESEFVWCPKKIQMEWSKGKENRSVAMCNQKTEESRQPEADYSDDDKTDHVTQASTVYQTSHPSRQPALDYSSDEEDNNEDQANVNFKQASTVYQTSHPSRQSAGDYLTDEEKNEDQVKGDRGHSPNNTDPPGTNVNLSASSTDNNSQNTAGKDTDLSTNLDAEQASTYENSSGQEHSPRYHSIDPSESNVNSSASSTINSGQKTDGEKPGESHAEACTDEPK
ncbi:opioid growth factor receptor-like protein 1 [Osmerus eperlanus]|uniref:opioid growth factor receptor-like protein 1 n=1 Tax=Osmerus eperlanus TaxID=29151 RepID=UPI002E0D2A65